MKLTLILLLLVNSAFAQEKRDNIIIADPVPYSTIKSTLFQNGYTFENNDTTYITTTSKELSKGNMSVKFMFIRSDSNTFISALGRYTIAIVAGGISTAPSDFERIDYRGMKGGPIKLAWAEMDRIAKLLSPVVNYGKR